ncbi:MAG: AAA family ATPase, partial [Candidatus Palauibacterales bacterium]|nr:AAA family ATPase [Candidatus Palauibacterales bacterium]
MLLELRIRNYAVIEELSLRLEPGLNALTGETGAGKSIVVGALSLVLGERASGEVIRAGEERAVIEAVFDIGGRDDLVHRCEEAGIDVEDGCLVLKRELNAGGRSRGWINGSPATAALMGELGGALVDIHGQHEHQALLHAGPQREILDAYAGATTLAEEVRACWIELSEARRRVAEIEERRARTEERAELLRHQVDEIEAAALASPDEDLTLGEEERLLSHAEELLERSSDLHDETYAAEASIYDRLGRVRRALDALGKVDPQGVEALSELHDTAYYAVQELGERLGRYRDAIEQNPASLERVRARIDLLFRLKSRYGPTLEGVIETGRRAREELEALDAAQFELEAASGRAEALANRLGKLAARLSEARREAAEALGSEVTSLLPELGMPDGRFELRLASRTTVAATG